MFRRKQLPDYYTIKEALKEDRVKTIQAHSPSVDTWDAADVMEVLVRLKVVGPPERSSLNKRSKRSPVY